MSYKVVVACVLAKDQQGKINYHYEGAIIPWLNAEQAKRFVAEGLVEKSDVEVEDADGSTDEDGVPAKSAPKSEWVDYAVADGYDRAEVEDMTKADIQALFD